MSALEYESLVALLVERLIQDTPLLHHQVGVGGRNRIVGASGYRHQIDVSLSHKSSKFLIEVKYWKRPVGVQAILAMASRLDDISKANPEVKVFASMVSTKQATSGGRRLAEYFGINIDVVVSIEEYAIRLANQIFVGVHEKLVASDQMSAKLSRLCGQCGIRFEVEANEYCCSACIEGA